MKLSLRHYETKLENHFYFDHFFFNCIEYILYFGTKSALITIKSFLLLFTLILTHQIQQQFHSHIISNEKKKKISHDQITRKNKICILVQLDSKKFLLSFPLQVPHFVFPYYNFQLGSQVKKEPLDLIQQCVLREY